MNKVEVGFVKQIKECNTLERDEAGVVGRELGAI
jgi:hypothetical protein